MLQAYRDFIIIKLKSLFNEEMEVFDEATGRNRKVVGHNGEKLVLNVKFDPAKHATIKGEVVSVPKVLSHMKLHQNQLGDPSYITQMSYSYRWLDDIAQEVEVGDTIYYHYNAVMRAVGDKQFVDIEGTGKNRIWYVKVRYDQVFCAVRNEKIIMIAGYSLIRPNFESWDDIARPTPVTVNGKPMTNRDGSVMMKPKDQWIVVKSAPGHKFLEGFVEHIGTPINGDKCECKVGQKILYHRNADWSQPIEGKNYFTILQRHLIGRFEEEE